MTNVTLLAAYQKAFATPQLEFTAKLFDQLVEPIDDRCS